VVVPAVDGTTDFSVLQNELKGRSTRIVMVAFDLLYLNGRDLRGLPLHERKAVLKKTIADTDVQFSESFEISGLDIGFPVDPAIATKVIHNEVHVLIVTFRHDRRRPIGLTHNALHGTEPGLQLKPATNRSGRRWRVADRWLLCVDRGSIR